MHLRGRLSMRKRRRPAGKAQTPFLIHQTGQNKYLFPVDTYQGERVGDPVSMDRRLLVLVHVASQPTLHTHPPKSVARDDDIDADLEQKSNQIAVAVRV